MINLNRDYIYKIVKPYLNEDNELNERDFDKIFEMLNLQEKYKVIEVLIDLNIEIIYPDNEEDEDRITNHGKKSKDEREEKNKQLLNNQPIEFKESKNNFQNIQLTNEQLCVMYQNGDERALEMLFTKNYRLIASRVIKYVNKYKHKLDFDDLIEYGFFGMLKAVKKFNTTKDVKFTTYSIWWIDQSILRAIADYGFTVRLPVHVFESINYLNRIQMLYNFKTEQEYIDYVIKDKGYSIDKIKNLLAILKNIYSPASLNTLVGEDTDAELIEFIPDSNPTTEELVEAKIVKEEIQKCLALLKPREAEILKLRFGLDGNRPRTLEEIGKIYGITRERIRQIEAKALRRLRHPSKSKILRDFI